MKINRHNYEAFLLDQLEGKLSVEEQQELEKFLVLNPDCSRELPEIEPWILEGEKMSYHNSQLLKKEIPNPSTILTEHNFDMFSIARMEGDLEGEQIKDHQDMLEADDQKAQQWKQWLQARLIDVPLVYEGKEQLLRKRPSRSRILWISISSAAAALALFILLFRAEPELPQQESYIQESREELSGQGQEPLPEKEIQTAQVIAASTETVPRNQAPKDPVLVPSGHEPVSSNEALSISEALPEENIQPLPLAFSAQRFNTVSMAREVDSDQIEPLQISPVPVQYNRLTFAKIADMGVQEVIEEYAEEKDLSLWKIANAGIKGINKLAGSDISLMASKDEEGEVSGFQLKSKRFSLARPLGRDE